MLRAIYAPALILAAGVLAACQDAPLASGPIDEAVPLAVTDAEREELQAALLFAGERSVLGLQHRALSSPLASALISLLQRVERDDRTAVEQGVGAARAEMQRYGAAAGAESSSDPDLEVLALTLDATAQLARRTERLPTDPVVSAESSSRQER